MGFLSLAKSLRLFVLILISTVQKIIPILITRVLNIFNSMIIFVCIITFLVIFYNSIMLLSLIKILALSRINNLVWFLVRIMRGIQFFYLLLTISRIFRKTLYFKSINRYIEKLLFTFISNEVLNYFIHIFKVFIYYTFLPYH